MPGGFPKSDLLGVTVALIHVAGQQFLAVWNGLKLVLCQLQRKLALRLRNKSVISHLWQKIAHTPWHILKQNTRSMIFSRPFLANTTALVLMYLQPTKGTLLNLHRLSTSTPIPNYWCSRVTFSFFQMSIIIAGRMGSMQHVRRMKLF